MDTLSQTYQSELGVGVAATWFDNHNFASTTAIHVVPHLRILGVSTPSACRACPQTNPHRGFEQPFGCLMILSDIQKHLWTFQSWFWTLIFCNIVGSDSLTNHYLRSCWGGREIYKFQNNYCFLLEYTCIIMIIWLWNYFDSILSSCNVSNSWLLALGSWPSQYKMQPSK